jgi:hypothetical protein
MVPDEELLGVVVHSGVMLARSQDVVAALRRITAFPTGLALDAVVVARAVHAEAAARREREATSHREAESAERQDRLRRRVVMEQRHLPQFEEGDRLRIAVAPPAAEPQWLDAYQSSSARTQGRYRLEASYWVTPLPADGLLTLVCAWPEIGLPEALTDITLPELAVRAGAARSLWDAEDL